MGAAAAPGEGRDGEARRETEAAVAGELRLLDPEVRRSPERAWPLLHPAFTEHGASGRIWDRPSILRMMAEPPEPGATPTRASRMRGVRLAPGVVHLTYDTDTDGRRAHRTSLWLRTAEGWQLYFHQGTLFTPDGGPAPAEGVTAS
jgi:hypothetical protein